MPLGVYPHKKGYKRQPFSKEWRENMGKSQRLKVVSEATKEKIRATMKLKGIKPIRTPEIIAKVALARTGEKQSAKTIRKRIAHFSGDKSHFWKGGVCPENKLIRGSADYKDWRTAVFERDNYTCVECGSRGVTLNADHIKPFAYYPELRLVIENGRTLCVPCHKLTDTYAGKVFKHKNESHAVI